LRPKGDEVDLGRSSAQTSRIRLAAGANTRKLDHGPAFTCCRREAIGLFAADERPDRLSHLRAAKASGVSEGRFPDGSTNIAAPRRQPHGPARQRLSRSRPWSSARFWSHATIRSRTRFELFNPTTGSVDLSGWYVSDNINKPKKYRIPAGTVLEPGGYTVIYRYQFQTTPGVSPSFAFIRHMGTSSTCSQRTPRANLTGYRAAVIFGPAPNNIPFARYLASTGPQFVLVQRVQMGSAVLGSDPPEMLASFRTGRGAANAAPVVGPVVISEIMYHPPDLGTNDNAIDEFVELRSIVATNLPLFDPVYPTNHWSLRGAVDYTFTNDVWLAPGATVLLVNFDPVTNRTQLADFRSRYDVSSTVGIYGPYRGKLDNSGESLQLYRPTSRSFVSTRISDGFRRS